MKHSDLNVDIHGIALANGLPSGITAHPAFKAFMSDYKVALSALVLEKAADHVGGLQKRVGDSAVIGPEARLAGLNALYNASMELRAMAAGMGE